MSEMNEKPFEVAICGGGIGGLCLAIGLHNHGIPFTVYEAASEIAEVGAGMSFGRNSLRAMSLIDPAILTAYRAEETVNAWANKRQNWFEFRHGYRSSSDNEAFSDPGSTSTTADGLIYEFPEGYMGQSSIHRARFINALLTLVPPERIKLGKRVQHVTADSEDDAEDEIVDAEESNGPKLRNFEFVNENPASRNRKPQIQFTDGTSTTADVVVGCDGVKSRVRRFVVGSDHPEVEPRFTGKYCYRAIVDMDRLRALVGEERATNSVMYLGHHGHVVTYPIEHGTKANIVAFHSEENGKWKPEDWVVPCTFDRIVADFQGWDRTVLSIISLLDHNPSVWALFSHPNTPNYSRNHICLLGDAAHAGTPHQGAAGGQAIEDALVLSELLGRITDNNSVAIKNALQAYDAVRRPRAQRVVRTSDAAGAIYDFEDKELGSNCMSIREDLRCRFDWIWEHDPQEDVNNALRLSGIAV
ncbi:FAD/NAD-binding protein [Pyrenophora tritici-repentis]|nr:FAD/NAD-binding protein [Pyrenophora tritici-repentis]KAI2478310.1 FAD/NAD-binding protein [Pyrenophora tritici-repentis]